MNMFFKAVTCVRVTAFFVWLKFKNPFMKSLIDIVVTSM